MRAKDNGFQLVASDIEILRLVHELRLATITQVAAVVNRSYTRTHKRIAKLHERGYLACITRRPEKHAYSIGREAVGVLIEGGHAPRELAAKRLRANELKELGIRHQLFLSDIHARFIMLTREGPLRLTNWTEGPSLWDSVTTSGGMVLPVRPDAWLTLENPDWPPGKQRVHCFLEADRGTMSHARMKEKVAGFMEYFLQGRHRQKFHGMKAFRVCTITETRARAASLADEFRTLMPEQWRPAYPALALEDLRLEAIVPELRASAASVTVAAEHGI